MSGKKIKKSVTEKTVADFAERAVTHKGLPWSETEFYAHTHELRRSLGRDGATSEQLALYDKLVAAAPVKGGRFNRWSGD